MIIGVVLREQVYDNGFSSRAFWRIIGNKWPGLAWAQEVKMQKFFRAMDCPLFMLS